MPLNCLITMRTPAGSAVAEIRVNSIEQLARVMPPQVTSYDVRDNGQSPRGPVADTELHDLLTGILADAESSK